MQLTKVGGVLSNTTYKLAFAYGSSGGAASWNGATVVSSATASDFGAQAAFAVGSTTAGTVSNFGPIRRVAYYQARLPNAVLQALTNGSR